MTVLGAGLALTAVVTGILWVVYGDDAVFAAASFGLLATAIQVAAVALARPAVDRSFDTFILRWGFGMGLRLLGVVLFAVAAATNRDLFPALPTAFGFLGVLIPLLFMEIRFLRMSKRVAHNGPEGS